jgi:Lipocalin-like domain
MFSHRIACILLLAFSVIGRSAVAADANSLVLEGTWVMDSAYEVLADGKRTTNYGEHPKGLLIIDKSGRYSLQIFRPDRPKFASGAKVTGTPEEYREAVLGSSTHTGRVSIDSENHKLIFLIDASSFPNWEGTRQVRDYTFQGGTLTYSVPASASGNGTVAYSVWKRAQP